MIKWLISKLGGAKTANADSTATRTQSEFTAEIVRITSVKPHPNADRLEIATFEMAGIGPTTYEVVVGRSDFCVGDLAAYFSTDCILPTAHPDFEFLTKRLDGQGKSQFRLRAARIRKVFSQGLLVQLKSSRYKLGDSCAEEWGVTYHVGEVKGEAGESTPKKPKPQPSPVYGVDSLKKLPSLFSENEPVIITEKIHGTNFRFGWIRRTFLGIPIGWRFFVGSHRVEKGKGAGSYYGADLYSQYADKHKLKERTSAYRGKVFYGELFGVTYDGGEIQKGWSYGRKLGDGPGLVIFDVYDKSEGCWLPYYDVVDACDNLKFSMPPVLSAFRPATGYQTSWEGLPSVLDRGTIMEGVVVESLSGPRRKAKYVHQAYLEAQ